MNTVSTAYLLQSNDIGEFFSSFGYIKGTVITIPVLFGAKEFTDKRDALAFVNANSPALDNFTVVKRTSTVLVEKA